MSEKRKQRRRENYNQLRKAGFTAEQANKLKDRSRKVIDRIVKTVKTIIAEHPSYNVKYSITLSDEMIEKITREVNNDKARQS